MSARDELYAYGMAGRYHSPLNSERMSARIDAFKDEVLREAAEKVRAADTAAISDDAREIFDRAADLIDPDKEPS